MIVLAPLPRDAGMAKDADHHPPIRPDGVPGSTARAEAQGSRTLNPHSPDNALSFSVTCAIQI